jgi:hypothetical protein
MWYRNVDLANRLYLFTALLAACLLITGTLTARTNQRKATKDKLN